jgi:T3SS (YopN, CesT) and YbjN peptide-binding chaperone 1/TY-Chap C-terminal domain
VTHPAFLVGDVRIGDDPDLPHHETVEPPDEPLATTPVGREHLDRLVDEALVPFLGQVPNRDDDGDIPVVSGTAVVFVRTLPNAPLIRIWAEVAVEVGDPERAKFEVAVLNRDRPFAKFVLVGDRIVAQVHVPASPFAPEHLRQTLAMMCELADEVDDDLAVRVGGRRFLEPDDPPEADEGGESDSSDMHPAMLTLLQIDADRPGSIKPSQAAQVCENNPELLLTLIRWNEEQEIAWRTARDEARDAGDPDDEADVCEHERVQARRTTKLLRKALRLLLDGGCERR